MVYTSFQLLFRAETLIEGTAIILASVLAVAYGIALWKARSVSA
jgi:hypothetical protein